MSIIIDKDIEDKDRIIQAYQQAKTMEELKRIRKNNKSIIGKLLSQYQTPIHNFFQQKARQL